MEREPTNMALAKDFSRESTTASSVLGMTVFSFFFVYKMLYI